MKLNCVEVFINKYLSENGVESYSSDEESWEELNQELKEV